MTPRCVQCGDTGFVPVGHRSGAHVVGFCPSCRPAKRQIYVPAKVRQDGKLRSAKGRE